MMIRPFLSLLLSAAPLSATLAVTKIGVTNTSAAVRISGATDGNCTLELSESSSFLPLHADVDNSKYPGSNMCAGRPDTKTSGSDLFVWLGHRVSDRALYADHNYYLRVTSGSDTVTLAFTTDTIGVGQSYPWPVPVDRRKWANRGFGITPTSLATKSPQVDPVTGVQMWPIGGMNDITMKEGPFSFAHWSDGIGWTNPSRIIDATTSGAQTSNTNPITLYIGPESDPHNWLYSATGWNDLGILVYACADDPTALNREFTITHSNNFSAGSNGVVTIPGSAVTVCDSPPTPLPQVLSASTDPNKPWPSAFPSAPFAGWGNGTFIGWDDRPTTLAGTVSSNVFAGSVSDRLHHMSSLLEVGNKVALPGCREGSGVCTVSALGGTAAVTVSGTPSNGAATATMLRAGIQVNKTTATGNLWVSVRYKIAEGYLLNTPGGALQTVCNTNSGTITTGDGHVGYLCLMSGYTSGMTFMYFVSSDGTSRLVWHGGKPWPDSYFTSTLGWDSADVPSAMNLFQAGQLQPDPADPRGWYLYLNNALPYEVYRLHYSGTVPVIDTGYAYDLNGPQPLYPLHTPSDYFDWYRVTPQNNTLASQLAKFPYYPMSIFGGGFVFYGASGHSLYFENILGGQDHAGWVAVGDVSSGSMVLTNVFSSYDGQGAQGRFHHASIHNVSPRPYPSDTVVVSLNSLPYQTADPTHPYEGEWQMPIIAVDRGTVGKPSWSTNTALPWPIDNTYLNTCPSNPWGYMGNRCVHFKVAKGGFCNTSPQTKIETAACPATPAIAGWNVSRYRQSLTTRPGDMFVDKTTIIGGGQTCYHGDCENFKIVTSLVDEGDGYTSFWAARDAAYDYCTILGQNPNNSAAYQTHDTGWIARASPMGNRGCSGGALVVQGKTEATSSIFEIPRTLLGHTDIVKGSCAGCIGFVSATAGNDATTLDDLFDLTKVKSYAAPTWHGSSTALGGGVQAYAVSPGGTSWFTDANTINGNVGGPGELNNAGTGAPSTITNTSCPDVYLITVTGTTDYKYIPLRGVAGSYPLQEVSSPTVDLCSGSVPGFTLAYAYRNGEAMSGTIAGADTSQAGQVFIKVPAAQAQNLGRSDCNVTQHWANTPCVIGGNWIGGGFYRQRDYLQNDGGGIRSRWLTSGLEVPLAQYPYSAMIPLDSTMAWLSWSMVADWGTTPWIVKLPRFIDDSATSTRTDYIIKLVTVSRVAGSTKARVRFGRNKDFYCVGSEAIAADGSLDWSGRKEACVTDAGSGPFRFAGETQTLTDCASGCVISVPLVAQTINYAQAEHLDDSGAIVQTDPVQVLVAGNVTDVLRVQ